jgi:phthalate 4,5-cis-dihydrodiol dehydrogenase
MTLRFGVIGLGRAFALMLPAFVGNPAVELVAAADPREEARNRFTSDFGGRSYADIDDLCSDERVDVVYVASPHELHVEHVYAAARHGKHVLVEKPMAVTIVDCRRMIEETRRAGVHLFVGHSHSFDRPYTRTRELIVSGAYGAVRMIQAMNFTDFVYRPRRPNELDTAGVGAGVILSQAAHQIDVVRLLAGAPARSVRAFCADLDSERPTQGAYNAQISFASGVFASLTYSGYGRFDTDEFNGWIGEMGRRRSPSEYGTARRMLDTNQHSDEGALKESRSYGALGRDTFKAAVSPAYNHFGFVVACCEKADLRPMPDGVVIYGPDARSIEKLGAPDIPRGEVIAELHDVIRRGVKPVHTGEWGMATLEICLGLIESSRTDCVVQLRFQE